MHKIFRCVLVGVLIFGMTVNVSSAGRLFQRGCPAPVCCSVVEYACPPVTIYSEVTWNSGCECADIQSSTQPTLDQPSVRLEPEEVEVEQSPAAITPGPVDDSSPSIEPTKSSSPEPAIDIPVTQLGVPPMPETPAEQLPAASDEIDLQDMFDTPMPANDTEEDDAVEMAPEDDFFGPSETVEATEPAPVETVESEPAATEPVEDEAPTEENSPPAETDPLENLFDTPDEPQIPEDSKKDDATQPEEDSFDDLFGQISPPAELSAPGGLLSKITRQWTDDTAKYHCEARLVRVMTNEVVLANARGSELAVALTRLSDNDLEFVHQQVIAKRALLASQAAGEKLASTFHD